MSKEKQQYSIYVQTRHGQNITMNVIKNMVIQKLNDMKKLASGRDHLQNQRAFR